MIFPKRAKTDLPVGNSNNQTDERRNTRQPIEWGLREVIAGLVVMMVMGVVGFIGNYAVIGKAVASNTDHTEKLGEEAEKLEDEVWEIRTRQAVIENDVDHIIAGLQKIGDKLDEINR